MKTARLITLLLFSLATHAFAQYEVRKSAGGFTVVSKVPGRTYTVDVPGKEIKTYGADSADHPYLMVDGRFLQVLSEPLAEFHASASAGDEAVLRQQMQYEAGFYKIPLDKVQSEVRKLPGGRKVFLWSFTPPTAQPKRQLFVTLRSLGYVVVLGSALQTGQSAAELQKWLLRIAASVHATR